MGDPDAGEQGLEASTEEIARRAGVGVGTVFRHFPTKRELVEAVLLAHLETFVQWAREADARPDAASGLVELAGRIVDHIGMKAAMVRYLLDGEGLNGPARQVSAELAEVVERMLIRAQAQGGIRGDVTASEVFFPSARARSACP
ncbi:MAG TPA: helix-turn-helix domain-containing protein [Pseudonocardiaceae bacterium]